MTAANRHDITQAIILVDSIPSIRGQVGRPRCRPDSVYADRAYHDHAFEAYLRGRGIQPRVAHRGKEHGSGLGKFRWVVERTLAWMHQFKRLRIRYERRDDIHEAFLYLTCAVICYRELRKSL